MLLPFCIKKLRAVYTVVTVVGVVIKGSCLQLASPGQYISTCTWDISASIMHGGRGDALSNIAYVNMENSLTYKAPIRTPKKEEITSSIGLEILCDYSFF